MHFTIQLYFTWKSGINDVFLFIFINWAFAKLQDKNDGVMMCLL